jgi:hypothetical protein
MERKYMKINELTKQLEELLKDYEIKNSLNTTFAQLRIMGLLYGKFMYNKSMKNFKKKYTCEQVLSATQLTLEFLNKVDFSNLANEQHITNTVINAIQKQLEWNFFDNDELVEVKDMDL